jgi:hypothetical protein
MPIDIRLNQFLNINLLKYRLNIGRGRGIRTPGPLLPKQVLYQAELCPDRPDSVRSR